MMEILLESGISGVTYVCRKCDGTYPSSEFCYQWGKPLWCKPCGRATTLRRYENEEENPGFVPLENMVPNYASSRRRYMRRYRGLSAEDRVISTARRLAIKKDPCFYCATYPCVVEVEHYFPLAKGGNDAWHNLVASCPECNDMKGTRCGTWMLLRKGRVCE